MVFYRVKPVRIAAHALLAADRLRPVFLREQVATRIVRAQEMQSIDPELRTLRNLNTPEDYLAGLAELDFTTEHTEIPRSL